MTPATMTTTQLSQRQIDEIHFLITVGCPCCGEPLSTATIGKAYFISKTTVSRIKNAYYSINFLKLDLREHVKLVKTVRERARTAN